MTVCDRFLQKH